MQVYFIDAASPLHKPFGTFDEWLRDHNKLRECQAKLILGDTNIGTRPTSFAEMATGSKDTEDGILRLSSRVALAADAKAGAEGIWAHGGLLHNPTLSQAGPSGSNVKREAEAAPALEHPRKKARVPANAEIVDLCEDSD